MNVLTALTGMVALMGLGDPERARLVEQALDQGMQLTIQETSVVEAFQRLTTETGVNITAAPEVLDLLPYGKDTRISATLEHIPLREGLTQLLLPLGMTFETTPDGVRVLSKPALLRIGRRATWAELDGLNFVREADWAAVSRDREALRAHVQFRVPLEDPAAALGAAVTRVGAGPGDQVLTLACESLGWTWFPEGQTLVILPAVEQVRRQLGFAVSIRFTHRPLVEVLQQLARKAGVPIRHEPGVLASLPVPTRQNFSLLAEGITVGEALEQIAGATGLGYRIENDGVVFYHPGSVVEPPATAAAAPPTATRDPYVAKLALPAKPGELQVEILIRESELSPEAISARKELVRKADEILRLQLPPQPGN